MAGCLEIVNTRIPSISGLSDRCINRLDKSEVDYNTVAHSCGIKICMLSKTDKTCWCNTCWRKWKG